MADDTDQLPDAVLRVDGSRHIIGANAAATWTISGANAGDVNGLVAFTGVENLTGGTAVDRFKLLAGGSLSGKADGAAPTSGTPTSPRIRE